MEKIVVKPVKELTGEVNISCAKNSVLPIIAASILSSGDTVIENSPILDDVLVMYNLLRELNCKINISKINNNVFIDTRNLINNDISPELIRKMRASFLIMGPMLTRFGHCKLSLPGGCNIGSRPIDLHLKGFKLLGAKVEVNHGYVEVSAKKLKGNKILLDYPSVGATENIIMAAVLADGKTVIENSAEEPEILDLIDFLNKMGAEVIRDGNARIIINGVSSLKSISYKPIYDRIEAGTFMIAAGITNSKIKINGVNKEYLKSLIEKLTESGMKFEECNNESIIADGRYDKKPLDIETLPYPGFPTDMQSLMTSYLSIVRGRSTITETVFENRFMHVSELKKMGANIDINKRMAIINGVKELIGCEVESTDLRAGAAMILAGLVAKGSTTINGIHHIDRGYVNIEKKFALLGVDIIRTRG